MQDHDAAASTQDQYLSEDSDDNMDVIMEEPILEVEGYNISHTLLRH